MTRSARSARLALGAAKPGGFIATPAHGTRGGWRSPPPAAHQHKSAFNATHPSPSPPTIPSAPTHICICPHLPQTPCHSSDSSRPSRLSDTRPGPFRQPGSQRRADRRNQGANIAAIGNRVPRNAIDRLLLRFITVSTVLERAGCALQSLLQQRSEHTGTSKPSGNQLNEASLP